MKKIKDFKSLVIWLGGFNTVLFVTVLSIVLSVVLTVCITMLSGTANLMYLYWRIIVGTAILVPLIVAPIVSYSLVKLVFQILSLETEMRKLATIDALTGLLNRGAMITRALQLHQLAQRESQPLVMLMVDVDFFKKINDQYGHGAGDVVLKELGVTLKEITRSSDLVGRIGGEEFLFCMFGATLEEATFFTERVHNALRDKAFDYEGKSFYITASIGVAHMSPDSVAPLQTLLHRADKALYQAKNAGRNQTVVFN